MRPGIGSIVRTRPCQSTLQGKFLSTRVHSHRDTSRRKFSKHYAKMTLSTEKTTKPSVRSYSKYLSKRLKSSLFMSSMALSNHSETLITCVNT